MVRISGRNASSIENAIVIFDCNHIEGIEQEYNEISQKYGYKN